MKSLSTRNFSFIVRIWWEEGETARRSSRFWRGWIQHIRSGEATYVQDLEGLLGFIERRTGSLQPPETDSAPPSTPASE